MVFDFIGIPRGDVEAADSRITGNVDDANERRIFFDEGCSIARQDPLQVFCTSLQFVSLFINSYPTN